MNHINIIDRNHDATLNLLTYGALRATYPRNLAHARRLNLWNSYSGMQADAALVARAARVARLSLLRFVLLLAFERKSLAAPVYGCTGAPCGVLPSAAMPVVHSGSVRGYAPP